MRKKSVSKKKETQPPTSSKLSTEDMYMKSQYDFFLLEISS